MSNSRVKSHNFKDSSTNFIGMIKLAVKWNLKLWYDNVMAQGQNSFLSFIAVLRAPKACFWVILFKCSEKKDFQETSIKAIMVRIGNFLWSQLYSQIMSFSQSGSTLMTRWIYYLRKSQKAIEFNEAIFSGVNMNAC